MISQYYILSQKFLQHNPSSKLGKVSQKHMTQFICIFSHYLDKFANAKRMKLDKN